MYRFTTKLRLLKAKFKNLHHQHTSHISNRVARAKAEWNKAQLLLDRCPTSAEANSRKGNSPRPTCFYVKRRCLSSSRGHGSNGSSLETRTQSFSTTPSSIAKPEIESIACRMKLAIPIRDQKELWRMATKIFSEPLVY
ncbi:hypothetical protein NC653_037142 [Populus alba x Populus x berolinensis]|uniref:Uncharacterized protein n=1 Tax=Populus alba x Populus x berolinensis TaxID=444605 RepID=A0AAD6PVQ6_9ROSI|nr:hypothetical protein NC653_037142 [Populus alba x Populus x berolinensis]